MDNQIPYASAYANCVDIPYNRRVGCIIARDASTISFIGRLSCDKRRLLCNNGSHYDKASRLVHAATTASRLATRASVFCLGNREIAQHLTFFFLLVHDGTCVFPSLSQSCVIVFPCDFFICLVDI